MPNFPFSPLFKLAKDTGFELEQQRQRNAFYLKLRSTKETTPEK
ncbi:hypothetical protein V3H32_22960 [Vibrio parahaemolyticus]